MSTINTSLGLLIALNRAQATVARRMECLSVHGLSFHDLILLYLIGQTGQARRIDLASQTGLTASGVTRLLQPLEKMGLVGRETNARDARVSLVTLTGAGRTVLNDALQTANATASELLPEDQLLPLSSLSVVLKLLGGSIS